MSQSPYVWNRNNPVKYSDPSGYQTIVMAPALEVGGDLLLQAGVRLGLLSLTQAAAIKGAFHDEGGVLGVALKEAAAKQSGDKPASTPVGSKRAPSAPIKGTSAENEPAEVGGREHSGHALDRAQEYGIPPSATEDAIQNGTKTSGKYPGTTVNTGNGVTAITNSTGKVITVHPNSQ